MNNEEFKTTIYREVTIPYVILAHVEDREARC